MSAINKALWKRPLILRLTCFLLKRSHGNLDAAQGAVQETYFADLVDCIVSQQLSVKAAATIYSRLEKLCSQITPEKILSTEHLALRSCGLSNSKVAYVKDLALKTTDGTLQLNKLDNMPDEEVIKHLIVVKGIGRWTAEMKLMFTLQRPDILPLNDVGIQNAFVKHYGFKKDKRLKTKMLKTAKSWQPYRTLACWYLWKSLDNE